MPANSFRMWRSSTNPAAPAIALVYHGNDSRGRCIALNDDDFQKLIADALLQVRQEIKDDFQKSVADALYHVHQEIKQVRTDLQNFVEDSQKKWKSNEVGRQRNEIQSWLFAVGPMCVGLGAIYISLPRSSHLGPEDIAIGVFLVLWGISGKFQPAPPSKKNPPAP
jgi:hypothetical protein